MRHKIQLIVNVKDLEAFRVVASEYADIKFRCEAGGVDADKYTLRGRTRSICRFVFQVTKQRTNIVIL